ncbi:XXYS1_4_G0000070.mRNA.1.CDS.1 [Saccharomyces cerevisiae]|nr:XXYS1_4_G0000070.mRNA.1.CDS.1 [Saccharomyces cerevisiae]
MPIIGVPMCLRRTLFRACEVSAFGQKEYPNFRFGPSYRSLCLSPYSICCKWPPMEEVILYYPSPDSLIKIENVY